LLNLLDVHTYYGESHILQGISLEVRQGHVVALLGRNGMGKTTTIRSIIGFTPPRSGVVRFKGIDIKGLPPNRIAKMGIGLVPQGRRIFPSLSVTENLTMSARKTGKPGEWTLERIHSLFPILKERADLKADLLSGGEQQMLCIGRALMTNPDLLLMDEPSEGLAIMFVREVGNSIVRLKKSGFSILLVEQNLSIALNVSDDAYILSKGEIVYKSSTKELRDNEEVKTKYIGVA
jgi:branched-chain amino acid transport system ATP-binding protein